MQHLPKALLITFGLLYAAFCVTFAYAIGTAIALHYASPRLFIACGLASVVAGLASALFLSAASSYRSATRTRLAAFTPRLCATATARQAKPCPVCGSHYCATPLRARLAALSAALRYRRVILPGPCACPYHNGPTCGPATMLIPRLYVRAYRALASRLPLPFIACGIIAALANLVIGR